MKPKSFYIKERHNPQLKKPYYVACGQLSKKEAAKNENSVYGTNIMMPYSTEVDYKNAIEQLEQKGYTVHIR